MKARTAKKKAARKVKAEALALSRTRGGHDWWLWVGKYLSFLDRRRAA